MRRIILVGAMCLPLIGTIAQETVTETRTERIETTVDTSGDSIIIRKGRGNVKIKVYEETTDGNTKHEEKLFEGVYLTRVNSDRSSILDALPFAPQKRNSRFVPHSGGFYLGFGNLSNNFFNFDSTNRASLNASNTWEIGANLFDNHFTLSRDRHWGLTYSLGWGYRSFRLDGNQAFLEKDGMTGIFAGDDETYYSKSRLRYFYFRIPISFEWQTRINGRRPIFFTAGPEVEIRHGVKSMAKVNGEKKTLGKGMYVHPIGINLLAQAGFDNIGFYLRYSTYGLFEKNKGPEAYPLSFGACLYW